MKPVTLAQKLAKRTLINHRARRSNDCPEFRAPGRRHIFSDAGLAAVLSPQHHQPKINFEKSMLTAMQNSVIRSPSEACAQPGVKRTRYTRKCGNSHLRKSCLLAASTEPIY